MARKISISTKAAVFSRFAKPNFTFAAIQRDFNLTFYAVKDLFEEFKAEYQSPGKVRGLFAKTEAYYTEEEMLKGLPEYKATNNHLITPINPNWKLWK